LNILHSCSIISRVSSNISFLGHCWVYWGGRYRTSKLFKELVPLSLEFILLILFLLLLTLNKNKTIRASVLFSYLFLLDGFVNFLLHD
jgi:hypothetical protein